MVKSRQPFNIMVFPNGPICNLECDYCYYLSKTELYPETKNFQMSEELLEEFTKQYVEAQPTNMITFGWQGGEPTLRGLDFFKKAVALQKKYVPDDWQCDNSFQTNGVLLNDDWCKFLAENNFLVGLSIDGPAKVHDAYRKDKQGRGSHERVVKGLNLLKKHKVEYNILCVVDNENVKYPLEVYNFFKEQGAEHIQFIPIIEHLGEGKVSSRTVKAEEYGKFLIEIFNHWLCKDLGKVFVQIFEQCVSAWAGMPPGLCVFAPTCGQAAVMEHNGDIYACDHFVFPDNKLGNIKEKHLGELMNLEKQILFGRTKRTKLADKCKNCQVSFICNGGCIKNRIIETPSGNKINYLCQGYQRFFNYLDPFMKEIINNLRQRMHPEQNRKMMKKFYKTYWAKIGKNDDCPCASGKKYKRCCLSKRG